MQRVLTNMTDSLNQVTGLVNTLSNTVKMWVWSWKA